MDPISAAILQTKQTKQAEEAGDLYWESTYDSNVSITGAQPLEYTVSGNSAGGFTSSNVLSPDQDGIYFDVKLSGGFSSSPTQVAWLGVMNTPGTTITTEQFVGWYWSGAIWHPSAGGGPTGNSEPLESGVYRVGVRLRSNPSGWDVSFLKIGASNLRGPIFFPNSSGSSNLRLMMRGQGGFQLPVAEIMGGRFFKGGGGLF